MKQTKTLLLLLAVAMLTACHKQTPEELFAEKASGVVLILHKYCYEVTPGGGLDKIYTSGIGYEGNFENFSRNPEEDQEVWNYSFGTGFFIDEKGTILTNRHVVQDEIPISDARQAVQNIINAFVFDTLSEIEESKLKLDALEYEYGTTQSFIHDGIWVYDNRSKKAEIKSSYDRLLGEVQEKIEVLKRIDPEKLSRATTVRTISEIGIAYHDAYVFSEKDFLLTNPCLTVRVSEDEEVDLATIQLEVGKMPSDKYIFSFADEPESIMDKLKGLLEKDGQDELQMGQPLYMIGYNAGIKLANTKQGIKAQMTTGEVTQQPDGQRLLYSIPALPGSSGSPVIDENGRLRAVNFAKLNETGSGDFNFGVPLENIKEFLE